MNGGDALLCLFIVIMMVMNWGLEAVKWQRLFAHTYPMNLHKAFLSVLAGVSMASATPNRLGEFLGRVWHLPGDKRIAGGSFTFVAGIAQLIVTLFWGLIAVIWMLIFPFQQLSSVLNAAIWIFVILLPFLLISISLLYFRVGKAMDWISNLSWLSNYAQKIKDASVLSLHTLRRVLFYSFVRYLVFVIQYWAVLSICKVHIGIIELWVLLSFLFLLLSAVPSIAFLELGLRWELGIQLFGLVSLNTFGISLAMFLIWFINLILPAFLGSFLFLGRSEADPDKVGTQL